MGLYNGSLVLPSTLLANDVAAGSGAVDVDGSAADAVDAAGEGISAYSVDGDGLFCLA